MSILFSIAIVLYESMCCMIFFSSIMDKKQIINNRLDKYIILLSIAIPGLIISYFVSFPFIKVLLIIMLYMFIAILFYKSKFWVCIGSSIILYTTIIALDHFVLLALMAAFSASSETIISSTIFFPFAAIISKVLLSLSFVLFSRIISRNRAIEYVTKRDWIILIVYSIITILALITIIELCTGLKNIPYIVEITGVGLLFSTLLVFELLEAAAKHGKNVRENALIKMQLDIEMKSIVSLKNSYDMQRNIMHDYKNHITIIYQMLNTNNYDQALSYVRNLSGDIYYSLYRIKTNHDIIDVILNQKDQIAQKVGITMDIHAGDLSTLNLPAEDLVVIIANVLDNAIEACEEAKTKKIITVKLIIENDFFIFSVINPVSKSVKIVNNRIATTKEDKSRHGLGIQNVAMSLKKCNGDF